MIYYFESPHWDRFISGDPVYARTSEIVTCFPVGPYVGRFSSVLHPGRIAVMIVPVVVTSTTHEQLVIDPIKERRAEYQALGESYTKASDMAVCDYVDEAVDSLANMVNALVEVVAKQERQIASLVKKGKKRAKR